MQAAHPDYDVVADIGFGWDYRRSGLIKILKRVIDDEVSEIVVLSSDQLSNGTYQHVETLLANCGVSINVIDAADTRC
jgi:predicted site-specific integrase-resolvase